MITTNNAARSFHTHMPLKPSEQQYKHNTQYAKSENQTVSTNTPAGIHSCIHI